MDELHVLNDLIEWLKAHGLPSSANPMEVAVQAQKSQPELPWVEENLVET